MVHISIFLFFSCMFHANEYTHSQNNNLITDIPIKIWKTLRDVKVIKHNLNYSCGAVSLATILNAFYGK